ncbi:hypothetical protein [Bosea vaviloviae]|nr:hypothetical protein [Bosea vaviloviae]
MMATVLTCIAVVAVAPAAFAKDDALSLALGLNALIWSAMAVGANLVVA